MLTRYDNKKAHHLGFMWFFVKIMQNYGSKKRKYLRWSMKVLAITNESTCDGQRKYFHF